MWLSASNTGNPSFLVGMDRSPSVRPLAAECRDPTASSEVSTPITVVFPTLSVLAMGAGPGPPSARASVRRHGSRRCRSPAPEPIPRAQPRYDSGVSPRSPASQRGRSASATSNGPAVDGLGDGAAEADLLVQATWVVAVRTASMEPG